jgi:hypothetical protein
MKTCRVLFTQTCNNSAYLYAFIHNDIYNLLHTPISRQTLDGTGEVNEDQ